MIKKSLIVIICMVILVSSVYAAKQSTQSLTDNPQIAVTIINQEPDPAEPGRNFDVRFKFDNNGSGVARDIEVELLPEYPFFLDPGREALRFIGTLQSRQRGDVGIIVKYKLRVDKEAVEGENELRIRYRLNGGNWIKPDEFIVNIRTHDAILSINSFSFNKKILEPGDTATLKVVIVNEADSSLKNIIANLDTGDVPLIPFGTTNEVNVYKIDSKDRYILKFNFLVDPETKSGVFRIPLHITYSDDLGNKYFKNSTLGLIIGADPDLSITLDDTEIFEQGNVGEITIKVVNKGVTDTKFMNLKLMESPDYRILSTNEIYLGNIDSDDFETASFNVFVSKTGKNQILFPIEIEYMDINNNRFKDRIKLSMDIYSSGEAKKYGLVDGNGFIGIFIVFVIVIVGLYYYRRYSKKKKSS